MKTLKTITTTVCMLAMTFILSSCSDKSDDPDDSTNTIDMVAASILPGDWIIESITESESGKTTEINKELTILPFAPNQVDATVTNLGGYECWAKTYDPFISFQTSTGTSTKYGVVTFYRKSGDSLESSLVYEFNLILPNNDGGTMIFLCASLTYTNGILISNSGAYTPTLTGTPIICSIRMKKIL